MMKRTLYKYDAFFLLLFLLHPSFVFCINKTTGVNEVQKLRSDKNAIVLEMDVDEYEKHRITIEGKEYYSISAPNTHSRPQKGYPDLPITTRNIVVPAGHRCEVQIVEAIYEDDNVRVAPSKGHVYRFSDYASTPYTFSECYSRSEFYPAELVSLSEPFFMRDVQGCTVRINPFQYNPVSHILRRYKKLKLQITFVEDEGTGRSDSSRHTTGKTFSSMYRNHFINHELVPQSVGQTDGLNLRIGLDSLAYRDEEKMLVICCDSFAHDMRNFLLHKNKLGLPTTMTLMSQVGATADDVASYIQNAYDADSTLTYVLLVGDDYRLPSKRYLDGEDNSTLGGSDPSYALVSGDDCYPDLIVGRFCARNRSDVQTMVQRTIEYECESDKSWHHIGIGIASTLKVSYSPYSPYYGQDSPCDYDRMRVIRDTLLSSHFTYIHELYDGDQGGEDANGNPTITDVSNAVNQGASIINYLGHGDIDSWGTSGFDIEAVASLHNVNKLPFVFSAACDVGCFIDIEPCFAEKWLSARDSQNGKPVGAVGFYGASVGQCLLPPIDAMDAFNDMLAEQDSISFGALCFLSSSTMLSMYEDSAEYVFRTWNIFGDPSLAVIPNNNTGKTAFVSDEQLTDSVYQNVYVDVHEAIIPSNVEIKAKHKKYTRITGPFRTELGGKFSIKPYRQ